MTIQNLTSSPITPSERFLSIDMLRGVAVLGILIMNIQSYSMIEAAYMNPAAYGDLTGINKLVWILSHIFADQKFMTIFSLLFGAGILLMTSKVESTGKKSAGLHYRRTFWLFVIGLIHAYVLWHGDVLVPYTLCALFVYLFRKISPTKLIVIGIIFISISSILFLFSGLAMPYWPQEAYQQNLQGWIPGADLVNKEIAAFRGSWSEQMSFRVPAAIKFQTMVFLFWSVWRAGGLMLIGMALYKWGVLTAQKSNKFYTVSMIIGLLFGGTLISIGLVKNFEVNFLYDFSMFLGTQFNYWGSLGISLAYISIVMLIYNSTVFKRLKKSFVAVGRMAFTNYLLQTLICTLLFYGHGFGLFGSVERKIQILIVFTIWIVLLIVSTFWLKHFRFGPMEWLWRSLTYWKVQPMKLK